MAQIFIIGDRALTLSLISWDQIEHLTFEGKVPDAKESFSEVNDPGFRAQADRFIYRVSKLGGYGGLSMAERHRVNPWVWELTEWVLPLSLWAPPDYLGLKDQSDLQRLSFEGDLPLDECEGETSAPSDALDNTYLHKKSYQPPTG